MGDVRVLQPAGGMNRAMDATFASLNVREIPIEKIERDENQGRVEFDDGKLQELAESVRVEGVLQPVGVFPIEWDTPDRLTVTRYRLIWGERRWRAAQKVGLKTIPARVFQSAQEGRETEAEVRRIGQQRAENALHEALSAVEYARQLKREADALARLEPETPRAELLKRVGGSMDPSLVYKLFRLLEAPESLQHAIRKRLITSRDVAFQLESYWSNLEKKGATDTTAKREVQFRRRYEEWVKGKGLELSTDLVPEYAHELGLDVKFVRTTLKAAERVDREAEKTFAAVVEKAVKGQWTVKEARKRLKDSGAASSKDDDHELPLFERSETKGRARFVVHLDRLRHPEVTDTARREVVRALRDLASELEHGIVASSSKAGESAAG